MTMYAPPFHRRILPWLFFAIFLTLAPILIFYTAGYRYNPKKSQIERNGTLIVDSFPKGASVIMDGKPTGDETPVTFQDISPGFHDIRLERAGYRGWEKTLEVRPEQVTFANNIWLWRENVPSLALDAPVVRAAADPDREKLALVMGAATQTAFAIWAPDLGLSARSPAPGLVVHAIRWRDDGQALVVNGLDAHEITGWSAWNPTRPRLEPLPNGQYLWYGDELIGTTDDAQVRLNPRTNTLVHEPLLAGLLQQVDGLEIRRATSTPNLLLVDRSFLTRELSLPAGDWRVGDVLRPTVFLKDGERWLGLNPRGSRPLSREVNGDYPRWHANRDRHVALFLNRTELWKWAPDDSATLLWRQSEPLVQAVWHRSGTAAFLATKRSVMAIDLDDRNGRRVVTLADFDEVRDLAVLDRTLYVAGLKDGMEGLWALEVE